MDFDLPEHVVQIRGTIREFAQTELAPVIGGYLEREEFPSVLVRKLAALGVFGLPYPEEHGGSGAGLLAFAVALEELSRVSPSIGAIVFAHSSPSTLVYLNGTPEQKRRWLVPLARGEILGAIGLTEPSGGSDVANLRTQARLRDGTWTLRGSKAFITNTGTELTGVVVAAAVTDDDPRRRLSSFIVPAGVAGLRTGPPLRKIGWRLATTCELFFDDCALPQDALLGQRGDGARQMLTAVTYGRVCVGAIGIGLAQACFDAAKSYAREREAFGHRIAEFEGVSFPLADIGARIEATRLLTYKAAWLADRARPFRAEASMAKLFGSELAVDAARAAIQILGSPGISRDHPISWLLDEAKVLEIVEGTSEVQRLLLARLLGVTA
jgi:alkylation response protein AidB-like acyl-CoA dehydrogenase